MRGDTLILPMTGSVRRHEWAPKHVPEQPRRNTARRNFAGPQRGESTNALIALLTRHPDGLTAEEMISRSGTMTAKAVRTLIYRMQVDDLLIKVGERVPGTPSTRNSFVYALSKKARAL